MSVHFQIGPQKPQGCFEPGWYFPVVCEPSPIAAVFRHSSWPWISVCVPLFSLIAYHCELWECLQGHWQLCWEPGGLKSGCCYVCECVLVCTLLVTFAVCKNGGYLIIWMMSMSSGQIVGWAWLEKCNSLVSDIPNNPLYTTYNTNASQSLHL